MEKAILGKKLGMSQIFAPDGTVIPVTVIQAGPCPVVQVKTMDRDGYEAIQIGFGDINENNVNKPNKGQFKQAKVKPTRMLREFRLSNSKDFAVGQEVKCDIFAVGEHVDVVGITRGRGFTGTVQRWNTHMGPATHGSGYHRGVGALAAATYPGRVFKNRKLPGQYGSERVTIQNLEIVRVDAKRNLLLVAGSVPGPKGGFVTVKQTLKKVKASRWFKESAKAPAKKA